MEDLRMLHNQYVTGYGNSHCIGKACTKMQVSERTTLVPSTKYTSGKVCSKGEREKCTERKWAHERGTSV